MRKTLISRALAGTAGLALIAGLTATTTPPPAAAAGGCSITFSSYPSVKKHSTGSRAKAAECLLRSQGYDANVNGRFWTTDVAATKKFQKAHHITATGTVGRRTWTALLADGSRPRLSRDDHGAAVSRLQRALTAAGHPVQISGGYGGRTTAAVKSFQRYQGWSATGVAGSKTWAALQRGDLGHKPKSSSKGAEALAFAKKQLGDSYAYGSTGPNSWDCSGLTGGAWKAAGVKLPRTSQAQYRVGKKVSKANLKKGDLVFFYSGISHVAIYAGNGKVIHASQPGKPVSYIKMKYMPYEGARRPA